MKAYITPALVAKGGVVTLTQGGRIGVTDPDEVGMFAPIGSVGFSL
jgi:hypothetical protein